jgi:hypothetical protein
VLLVNPRTISSGSKRLLSYQVDRDDLTSSLLDLAELLEEIPETRLGNDIVGSEESHSEELGDGFLLGRELTADHLKCSKEI